MTDSNNFKPWLDSETVPLIQIKNVTKRFGEFVAVDDVSLDIYTKELFCLLGGSGSGKSTLLRMIAGFEDISQGDIFIENESIKNVPPYQRPVNMMFQSYALFPHMSVEKNIAYGLERDRIAKSDIKQKVAHMLELVQLSNFAKRKPHQLSGGQRQRVALARSLIKEPKVLLLDEPLGALDKKLREETQFELINIQENLGVTFIVVTHDQEEAMTLASRIGVMRDGEIVQVGEPHEIYEFPQSRYIADFIGNVNIFEGRVSLDEDNHMEMVSAEAGCTIRVAHGVSCTLNQQLWFAVRPEKMKLSRKKSKAKTNAIEGIVHDIAYLGGQSIYHIRLDSGKIIRITEANTDRRRENPITWEEKVYITWGDASGVVLIS